MLEFVLQLGSPPGSEATTAPLLALHRRAQTSVCHHLMGQTNKRGKMMENHPFCGIGATKLGLEKVGIKRGRKTWNVPAISSMTPEKPGQPILVKSTTTSGSQAGIWMECCTTPFLITEDYSC